MPIDATAATAGQARSPQLPLEIPSGRVHVYFVAPSVKTNEGKVERTSIYFTVENDAMKHPRGSKVKFMAKDPRIREDLMALGQRTDLATLDEEFVWATGGGLTIRLVKRGA